MDSLTFLLQAIVPHDVIEISQFSGHYVSQQISWYSGFIHNPVAELQTWIKWKQLRVRWTTQNTYSRKLTFALFWKLSSAEASRWKDHISITLAHVNVIYWNTVSTAVGYKSVCWPFCTVHRHSQDIPRCAVEDEFREITHNNGHYAVQGHSKLPIMVPMENMYATCVHNSNLRPILHVSEI